MKKIPCLFARDSAGNLTSAYNSAALWVLDGEGVATRQWDGTAVRITHNGYHEHQTVWARFGLRSLILRPPPTFDACQDPDPITGYQPGWVVADRPCDKWIRAAVGNLVWQPGTYEACGPSIGGNPEGLDHHTLIRHGAERVNVNVPLTAECLTRWFARHPIEGIVWWRNPDDQDCDKVKITAAALGVSR